MQRLTALLDRYARRPAARRWIGPRPDVRDGRMAAAIAAQVGLPSVTGLVVVDALMSLTRAQAAHVLAVAGTTSLAYGRADPRRGALAEAAEALAELGPTAVFLANGRWQEGPSLSWMPLTDATFECGVIGWDDQHAFVFWVEEED